MLFINVKDIHENLIVSIILLNTQWKDSSWFKKTTPWLLSTNKKSHIVNTRQNKRKIWSSRKRKHTSNKLSRLNYLDTYLKRHIHIIYYTCQVHVLLAITLEITPVFLLYILIRQHGLVLAHANKSVTSQTKTTKLSMRLWPRTHLGWQGPI